MRYDYAYYDDDLDVEIEVELEVEARIEGDPILSVTEVYKGGKNLLESTSPHVLFLAHKIRDAAEHDYGLMEKVCEDLDFRYTGRGPLDPAGRWTYG